MQNAKYLDPKIWGPYYWFFLHTLSMTYPNHPNEVTKKKYYEFIQNLPLFIPVEQISKDVAHLIEKYPVIPYLDNRNSFIKWTHFIHNKINEKMEKPTISLNDFYIDYYDKYKSKNEKLIEFYKWREKIIFLGIILLTVAFIYYLYDK